MLRTSWRKTTRRLKEWAEHCFLRNENNPHQSTLNTRVVVERDNFLLVTQSIIWPILALIALLAKKTNGICVVASQAVLRHNFAVRFMHLRLIPCLLYRIKCIDVCELISGKLYTGPGIALFLYNRPGIA